MSNKKAHIALLFALGLFISEAHQFFPYKGDNTRVLWFFDVPDFPPTIHWYMKDVLLSVRDILWMLASYKMASLIDRRLKDIVSIFLVYCVLDMLLYFICYRMYGYTVLYIMTGLFSFITIYRGK